MRPSSVNSITKAALFILAVVLLGAGTSFAQTHTANLETQRQLKLTGLPASASAATWVYVDCGAAFPAPATRCTGASVPSISVPAGTTSLVINVRNTIPTPVSVVIPGLPGGGTGAPVMVGGRVQSFTHEVAAGSTATPGTGAPYTWTLSSADAGTYLYQSGTHPSIQVPMGLFGALIINGPASTAYGETFNFEVPLLFSEIDPVQNAAVDALAAGPINPANYPSTVNYNPTYFLINGVAYTGSRPPSTFAATGSAAGGGAQTLLMRYLNAGSRAHAAFPVGLPMRLIAEDGNKLPTVQRIQSTVLLPAGKTMDVLATLPGPDGTYPVFDRFLDLTSAPDGNTLSAPDSGMLAYVSTGSGVGGTAPPVPGVIPPGQPAVVNDSFSVTRNVAFPGNVKTNDTGAVGDITVTSNVTNGTLVYSATAGDFTYTANANASGPDSFTYTAVGAANFAVVTLNLANAGPTTLDDGLFVNTRGTRIDVPKPGVLGNDTDLDGDPLTAVLVPGTAPAGLTLNADGSFSFVNATPGLYSFRYRAVGAGVQSPLPGALVSLEIKPVSGFQLTVTDPTTGGNIAAYRWIVEEDLTFHPLGAGPTALSDQAINFHKSYMPVVAQGCVGIAPPGPATTRHLCSEQAPITQAVLDPAKYYYISVLPNDAGEGGHTVGGTAVQAGQTSATVLVNPQPIGKTAQISVLVFDDSSPTDGAWTGNEPGLGGFQVTLFEAAGRYGDNGGQVSFDVEGAPIRNALPCAPEAEPSVVLTCADGTALISNLAMGKYTAVIEKPANSNTNWVQTSTIEGTRGIDAWVKAGEPPFFQEFGVPGYHVFVGFVDGGRAAPGGPNTLEGTVTNLHMSRVPDQSLHDSGSRDAMAHTTCWVGLNSGAGVGDNIVVQKCDDNNHFFLSGIPDGTYQLVVWDQWLDQIIAFRTVTFPEESGDLGNVPVFQWFSRIETNAFIDSNQDAQWQETEAPMANAPVTLFHRDGSLYQTSTTDNWGFYSFDEMFPFFNWLVFEADPQNNKPTGVDVIVDAGGPVDAGGILNPQIQPGGLDHRVQTGPVRTQALQGFLGQTSIVNWGQTTYQPGENGGITGRVSYASTRSEDDPRLAAINEWEPNVPNVRVRLYRQVPNGSGTGLVFVAETRTSSFDASVPTGCPGQSPTDPFLNATLGAANITKCYDGLHNFNQVRPGVYDGRYTFTGISAGTYVVEIVPPPGYELVKEEDKNVFHGDAYVAPASVVLPSLGPAVIIPQPSVLQEIYGPTTGINTPPCVGDARVVPDYLSLFPTEEAPFRGSTRPLCDRKLVTLSNQAQAVADFHLFTSTPVASHGTGMILDDLAQEFNPASPHWGEKLALPQAPVSIKDFNGREITRTYSDQWGLFNILLPSTWTANVPLPSGFAPAMHTACMNDPGPIPGPGGTLIVDPQYNPGYSTFCYTLQYMPGTTTYLDTPVVPITAFASGFPSVDCYYPDGTPVINRVDGNQGGGPFLRQVASRILTIQSQGTVLVPNPAYQGAGAPAPFNQKTVLRDYGFGATPGSVTLNGSATRVSITSWSNSTIVVRLTGGATSFPVRDYQLVVTRANGKPTVNSVTVTMASATVTAANTPLRVGPGGSIQAAIDAASNNQLILVAPGIYNELVVMHKPVRLQGYGAGATIISAVKTPAEKLVAWRAKVEGLLNGGEIDLLPGQAGIDGGAPVIGPGLLGTEEGAGVTVLATNTNFAGRSFAGVPANSPARIDGFTITGGDSGGGIFVNGWAHRLQVGNNRITGNSSQFHGGVRIGHPFLQDLEDVGAGTGPFGFNNNINIHHNAITTNGNFEGGAGGGIAGGIAICTGTDNYTINFNYICGNFSTGPAGGIGHFGLSNNGLISNNKVLFNQSFSQKTTQSGGGIFIGGQTPLAGALTLGAGHVTVDKNLIQGNHAAAGHGGGIRMQAVNGADVARNPGNFGPTPSSALNIWWQVRITNNMIVNNVAGWAGGGISLQDTARAFILHNTVARNDSTATVGPVFSDPDTSAFQPAGISSETHSPALAAAFTVVNANTTPLRVYSNPFLRDSIVWQNRSFHYDTVAGVAGLQPLTLNSGYWDLGLLGNTSPLVPGTNRMLPTFSVLTSTTGYTGYTNSGTNTTTNPQFAVPYFNGARTSRSIFEVTTLQALPALDEGGNFIDVRYGPIAPSGNYHLLGGTASASLNSKFAAGSLLITDIDGEERNPPNDATRGADEFSNAFTLRVASLTLAPASVPGGSPSTGTVTLTGIAPAGGVTVTITDNGSPVTSLAPLGTADGRQLVIVGGSSSASFAVTTTNVEVSTPVNFTASLNGSEATFTLTVTPVVAPEPLTIASFTLTPSSVLGGSSSTGQVTLSGAAPAGGISVAIDDNASTVTSFAAPGTANARTLTIAAGSNTGSFVINTAAVAAPTNVPIDAVLNGVTTTATLTVSPLAITSFTLTPSSVGGGSNSTGQVTLSGAAPAGGISVAIDDNASTVTSFAAPGTANARTLTIAAGTNTASFLINTTAVAALTNVPIDAVLNGVTTTATLTVNPATTIFTTQVPVVLNETDGVNEELGTVFTSSVAGQITGIRFYKSANETGIATRTGRIWTIGGVQLASVVFTGETASGWQQMSLATPLPIAANTQYVVSVNSRNTFYTYTNAGLASSIVNGSLSTVVTPPNGTTNGNGRYGAVGVFPTSSYQNSNYFRDVFFVPN